MSHEEVVLQKKRLIIWCVFYCFLFLSLPITRTTEDLSLRKNKYPQLASTINLFTRVTSPPPPRLFYCFITWNFLGLEQNTLINLKHLVTNKVYWSLNPPVPPSSRRPTTCTSEEYRVQKSCCLS